MKEATQMAHQSDRNTGSRRQQDEHACPLHGRARRNERAVRRDHPPFEKSGDWLPAGLEFHVAFMSNGNFRVSEIWDSREQFDTFGKRLMPVLKDVGIELAGEPETREIHNIIKR